MTATPPARITPRNSQPPRRGVLAVAEQWRDRPVMRYGLGLAIWTAAALVSYGLREHLARVPFVFFYLGISATSLLGGFGPALVSIVLAMAFGSYFMFEPPGTFSLSRPEIISLLAFGATASVISWLGSKQRRLGNELGDQSALLQEQNIELEIQMEESQSLQEELEQTSEELANANEELTRNRDFLAQAQASAQLGSWEWDVGSNVVSWSDQMFRVYGYEPGAFPVTFEKFVQLVHPDDRKLVQTTIAHSLQTHASFDFDHRAIRGDGAVRWLNARGRVSTNEQGEPTRMSGSSQDVTERKNAADAQRLLSDASEALASSLDYRATLATVAALAVRDVADWCSVAMGDESGRYENLAVSHRDPERVKWVEEYTRLNPPRFDTPTGVPQVLRTGKAELYAEIDDELLRRAASTDEERRVIRELGLRSAMIVPMVARGRTIGAISFVSAESQRQYDAADLWFAERLANRAAYAIDNARLFDEATSARAEAEAANAAKAQFLASMSHELRTPLNAIAGYAELMEIGVLGPVNDRQVDALGRLQRSRKVLNTLVEQVLSFARIEAGRIQFEITHVPLAESLSRLAEMIEPQSAGKRLSYDFDGCDPHIAVSADRDRLDQIMLNLIGNAVKYTPEGGSIWVTVDCDPKVAQISVHDTGPGIPADKHQVIFHPFVQLGSTGEATSSGVGLGLAISRDLARAMGGDISVQSVMGKGSTFTLTLPRSFG